MNDRINEQIQEQIKEQLNEQLSSTIPAKTRIDDDGIEVKWDEEKKAWFPNIDEEFIYRHNLNYGFVPEEENKTEVSQAQVETPTTYPDWYLKLWNDFLETYQLQHMDFSKLPVQVYNDTWTEYYIENAEKYEKKKIKSLKRAAKSNNPTWFEVDENQNKHIYVENMPLDVKLDEFVELVSKYGLLMYEPFTNIPKAKLYEDRDGKIKGDGTCCYLKVESVELALNLLDGFNLRGNTLKVSKAKFELKGDFDPQKRRRITNKEKRKIQKHQESLFRWGPETKAIRPKKDNTVILKNVFDLALMKENPELAFDIKEKINKETKNIGAFKSILVHDLHPEAVVQINFHDPNFSDIAVSYFNNKIWNGRKITAEIWDGKSKYKVKETEEEQKERLENWEKTLEGKKKENTEESNVVKEEESLENLVKALGGDEDKQVFVNDPIVQDSVIPQELAVENKDVANESLENLVKALEEDEGRSLITVDDNQVHDPILPETMQPDFDNS